MCTSEELLENNYKSTGVRRDEEEEGRQGEVRGLRSRDREGNTSAERRLQTSRAGAGLSLGHTGYGVPLGSELGDTRD